MRLPVSGIELSDEHVSHVEHKLAEGDLNCVGIVTYTSPQSTATAEEARLRAVLNTLTDHGFRTICYESGVLPSTVTTDLAGRGVSLVNVDDPQAARSMWDITLSVREHRRKVKTDLRRLRKALLRHIDRLPDKAARQFFKAFIGRTDDYASDAAYLLSLPDVTYPRAVRRTLLAFVRGNELSQQQVERETAEITIRIERRIREFLLVDEHEAWPRAPLGRPDATPAMSGTGAKLPRAPGPAVTPGERVVDLTDKALHDLRVSNARLVDQQAGVMDMTEEVMLGRVHAEAARTKSGALAQQIDTNVRQSEMLHDLAVLVGIDLTAYPAFGAVCQESMLLRDHIGPGLSEKVPQVFTRAWEIAAKKQVKARDGRSVLSVWRHLELASKLVKLQMTPADERSWVLTQRQQRLAAKLSRLPATQKAELSAAKRLDARIAECTGFYRLALERGWKMASATAEQAAGSAEHKAILVFLGFHENQVAGAWSVLPVRYDIAYPKVKLSAMQGS